MDQELKIAADKLMAEAHSYFELMKKRNLHGGCIWLTDQTGAMVVFTRGEYRHQLMQNIETSLDADRVYSFGIADTGKAP